MVPKIYQTVREYIDLCHRFCENMNLAYTELEDTINRATNFLFTQCLNVVLTSGIRSYSQQLSHLTQFCINLDELETVCGHLDNYLQYNVLDDASGRIKDFTISKVSVFHQNVSFRVSLLLYVCMVVCLTDLIQIINYVVSCGRQ
ncbi:unnamed protein product [Heterobilharzia americana]|nr:unnamed protein product [Heterobilharzia americana]